MAKRRAGECGFIPLRGTPGQSVYGNLLHSQQIDLILQAGE